MSVIKTPAEAAKQKVAIYFSPYNPGVKNFAARVRNDNPVETTLVWSSQFKGEVLAVDAVVIEKGCAGEEQIERAYRQTLPHVEIHYMTNEGQWYVGEAAAAPAEPRPAINAPAPNAAGAAAAANVPEAAAGTEANPVAGTDEDQPASPDPDVGSEPAADGSLASDPGFRVPNLEGDAEGQ